MENNLNASQSILNTNENEIEKEVNEFPSITTPMTDTFNTMKINKIEQEDDCEPSERPQPIVITEEIDYNSHFTVQSVLNNTFAGSFSGTDCSSEGSDCGQGECNDGGGSTFSCGDDD